MAYIRDRHEELTGFQESGEFKKIFDVQCDFVMVYRINDTLAQRIKDYRDAGYVIHLMSGISWGYYRDYLYGEWDGINHWDEAQEDRYGNRIMHGQDCPYMVPSITFADYLTEKIKIAVDLGVEAIHVEEPEFWDRGGYSPAFKREFEMYYKKPWEAPHSSIDARYKCARLKAYLYKRTIDRVSAAIKNYALTKYNKLIRFYVPTHSLLNYTQWKIVSPEASLTEVPTVDGYIAQIWTGTSREKNAYEGVIKERTFETAYLEYGVMQELVKGTGRRMWFLHDPIEDMDYYDWDDYRYNYLKTVSASILHPKINTFEVCPWPRRVFGGKYPKNDPNAIDIPEDYATVLSNNFQMLGDLELGESTAPVRTGILISDTSLYQRGYPDGILKKVKANEVGTVLRTTDEELREFENVLFKGKGDDEMRYNFEITQMLPGFYGLCLPLLKHGMPVRPVLLDNARRYLGYLNDYDVIVMSYEFCKPDYPEENAALANWVRAGGTLIYVGDGFDPFHKIDSFWTGKYDSAADQLFDLLNIKNPEAGKSGIYKVDKGCIAVWNTSPSSFCWSKENAEEWRNFFTKSIETMGYKWERTNCISERRGPYLVAAVFDENENETPFVEKGLFTNMYDPAFAIVDEIRLLPGQDGLYFDYSKIENETLRVIGTSPRVFSMDEKDGKISVECQSADKIKSNIRIRTPYPVKIEKDGFTCVCDSATKTALISYVSKGERMNFDLVKDGEWK